MLLLLAGRFERISARFENADVDCVEWCRRIGMARHALESGCSYEYNGIDGC